MLQFPPSLNIANAPEELSSTDSSPKKGTAKTATGSTMTPTNSVEGKEFKQEIKQQGGRKFPSLLKFFSSAPKDKVDTGQMGGHVKFVGTSAAAKQLLGALVKQLPSEEGESNGILRLMHATRKQQEMTFQLKKPNDAHATRAAKMEVTATYVQSILETAYPRENFEAYANIHDEFKDYLQKNDNRITLPELKIRLERFDQAAAEISTVARLPQNDIAKVPAEKITADLSASDFLKAKGMEINTAKSIGTGAFGTVFAAKMGEKEYVYKEQKTPTPLNNPELNNQRIWPSSATRPHREIDWASHGTSSRTRTARSLATTLCKI